MNNFIIKKYIDKLTKQDIINYLTKQNINIPEQDINTIYIYIKTKSNYFLNNHEKEILTELKTVVSSKTYHLIEAYYNEYKDKIKRVNTN